MASKICRLTDLTQKDKKKGIITLSGIYGTMAQRSLHPPKESSPVPSQNGNGNFSEYHKGGLYWLNQGPSTLFGILWIAKIEH